MNRVKVLHCGDIHLDMPFTSLGNDGDNAVIRRAELRLVFKRIIELAAFEKVDLLLICGDLFESQYVRKSTISFICDEFNKIKDIEVVMIPGNHDPDFHGSYYSCHKWPENVHILSGEQTASRFEDRGIFVFSGKGAGNMLKSSDVNIFMVHGTLDMNFSKSAFNPLSSEKLEALGADYIALGHFHNRIEKAGGKGIIYNPGSPEPLGFDEEGTHGVFISEISKEANAKAQIKVDFMPLNKRAFRSITVNTDGCNTQERLFELAANGISAAGSVEDLYSITLKGSLERGFGIDKKQLAAYFKETAFFVKIKDETMPDYDFEEIKKEPGLRGLFVTRMLDRIESAVKAGDEEGRRVAQEALYYGMEAMEQGEICI